MTVRFLDYIIDYKDINDSIFKVKVELTAKIYPDQEILYNFLHENNLVSTDWRTTIRNIQDVQYAIEERRRRMRDDPFSFILSSRNPSRESDILKRNNLCKNDIDIVNALCKFSEKNTHRFSATARMILDFSMGGRQPLTENRALNKIKEQVSALPKLRYALIEYLKKIGLIESNRNIYCEVLHKDI